MAKCSTFATMISISQHIEYLMMRNDCVVVPGWGALVANHVPSATSDSHISRPARHLGFNPSITHNDGLLATSLMRRHNISFDEACKLIADNVTVFRRQLATGSEVAFGRIGIFRVDEHNKLVFTPTVLEDACDEYFGLHSFEFKPLPQLVGEQTSNPNSVQGIFSRKGMKVAASIAALIGMGILLSTPVVVDKDVHTASLNITTEKTKPTTVKVTPVSKSTNKDMQFEVFDTSSPMPNPVIVEKKPIYNTGMPCDENGGFFLVINSCKKQHQAAALVKQYARKGIKARAISRGGYYHLVVAQSNNQQELIHAKKLLPANYRKAWICK